ncbi:hypothetical protein A8H34_32735 [Burkholderia thailandensis]|nr:hypothetical protein A8H34_32735 [Burkholderia thailandensis]
MLRNPPKLFRLINFKTQLQYPLQCGLILIKTLMLIYVSPITSSPWSGQESRHGMRFHESCCARGRTCGTCRADGP